jgi:ketosteroid isomerase-like protein
VSTTATEVVIALNRGNFDKVFDELVAPDAHEENRSRLPFPNRSPDVLRASFAELDAMVASARTWFSAVHWVSKAWSIVRFEREAVGKDGEHYAWTYVVVLEFRDGRIASMCDFELNDDEAAFTYAEERVQQAQQR